LSVFSPEGAVVSSGAAATAEPPGTELRPYLGLGYLHVGASLCAGKSYEVLARLFAELVERYRSGVPSPDGRPPAAAEVDEGIFRLMKEAARESAAAFPGPSPLVIDTAINGTRREPERRGSVEGIGMDTLTVGNLVRGTVDGIVRELADFRTSLGPLFEPLSSVVVSGSAVRKNCLFRESLERQFELPVRIPPFDGGAALGAALIGAVSAGVISLKDSERIIDTLWAAH
jgi:sedoheptulokinase